MRKIVTLLLIGITAFVLTGCRQTVSNIPPAAPTSPAIEIAAIPTDKVVGYPGNTIQVNSSEKVTAIPDIAEIVYSVRTENKDAATCQQNNNEAVAQVIELLKSLGIKETSIQTSDYYMHPIYSYRNNTTKVTGYEATTTLTVSGLPIDELGDILTQSVSTGINTVQSITYQVSRYDECYQEALNSAINSAHEKASAMADAAGCSIGHVISIQETGSYSEARYTDYARTNQLNAAKEELLADMSASIMPGEIEVEAGIVVEYQLLYTP